MEIPRLKLKPRTKAILSEWLFIIFSVNVLMYAYFYFSWWGLRDYLQENIFNNYIDSNYLHLEILIQGTLFGLLFGVINSLLDNTKIRRMSFGAVILMKAFLYILAILLSQGAVYAVYHFFQIMPFEQIAEMQQEITYRLLISIIIFFIFVVVFLNFLLHINRKFGPGVLFSMITGKYHKPIQERRIFMFLDMRDSTGTAERLGNYNYSRLIQHCIHDITDLILRYKAQVYQYVGDEIVLTWPTQLGIRNQNCLNIYFAFQQRLSDKSDFYMKRYDSVPFFKAGMDEGLVTVTEVGDIKRELAYHGEVLHTAARLEKKCNELKCDLLVTETLNKQLNYNSGYVNELAGKYQLRGKEHKEQIFGVARIA